MREYVRRRVRVWQACLRACICTYVLLYVRMCVRAMWKPTKQTHIDRIIVCAWGHVLDESTS